jgi:UDP-glucose 4-epimerase
MNDTSTDPLPTSSPALPVPAAGPVAARTTGGAVLITGVCGRLGKHLARVLHRERRVVGVDRRSFLDKPKDIEHVQVDIRRKKLKDVFRAGDIEAVVHLGVMHDPRASAADHHSWNVAGFTKLLEYVAQFQIPKLVVLSSANVYGPQPHNPQFLSEESPLLGGQNFSDIRDLVEVDMLAQSFFWKLPETETVILRPVHILGAVHNAPSNFLRKNPILTVMGFDPMAQVIQQADVVHAIGLALRPGIRGIFNLAGADPVPLSRIIRILGRQRISVPYSVARVVLRRMWALRLTTFPAPELDHIRYVCMVDDRRARQVLGFQPRVSLEDAVKSVDDARW